MSAPRILAHVDTVGRYRERLLPKWSVWLVLIGLCVVFATAFGGALGAPVGWVSLVALVAVTVTVVWVTTPVIDAGPEGLRVGPALLPRAAIGTVEALDATAARDARGPSADARTYLALRTWATANAVLIAVVDPSDPHPAWLVSCRRPHDLVTALQ